MYEYRVIEITNIYDSKKLLQGYLLQGKGNLIDQPKSNIIPFPKTKEI